MIDESDYAALLASARRSAVEFDRFLRERERQFLHANEPVFVQAMKDQPPSSMNDLLFTEMIRPKLRRKPAEWVRLMQETSDVIVGLRHLEILSQTADGPEDKSPSVGAAGVGELIEFLIYAELEVIYRILNRLGSGLGRTVHHAKKLPDVARLGEAPSLRAQVTKLKTFEKLRGELTHTVNFGQLGLVDLRIWEFVSLAGPSSQPRDVLINMFESQPDYYRHAIRGSGAELATLVQELYPEWRIVLDAVYPSPQ